MPILEVRALPQKPGIDHRKALARVCRELAKAMGEEPQHTWGTWHTLAPGEYVEGGDAPEVQPDSTHPPLVRLFAFEGRPPEKVEKMLEVVAKVLADALHLEEGNVFVTYDEGTSGRVHSGGGIVRAKPR